MAKRRAAWFAIGISAIVAAIILFWWAIQTSWLGSFPGRDVEAYSRWALAQLVSSIACLVVAIAAFVKYARTR
jgi:hypothetical protein